MTEWIAAMLIIPFAPQWVELNVLSGVGAEFASRIEFSARVKLQASPTDLVAEFDVSDATFFPSTSANQLFEGDSVELCLSGPGTGGIIQAVVDPGDTDGQNARLQVLDYREDAALKLREAPRASFTATRSAERYRVRVTLPWANVEVTPNAIASFGVRVSVNDAASGRKLRKLTYLGDDPAREFFVLPAARLGDDRVPEPAVAWAGYTDDLRELRGSVCAPASSAGELAAFKYGADELKGKLALEEGVAVARFTFKTPAIGQPVPALSASLADRPLLFAPIPNLNEQRRAMFTQRRSLLTVTPEVFLGEAFPAVTVDQRATLENAVGPVQLSLRYFDAEGQAVTTAVRPGRYGLVATLNAGPDLPRSEYRTLFRAPQATTLTDAVEAAMRFEDPPDNYAVRADRRYWHHVRQRLGTAVHYDTFVRVPAAYADRQDRKWPLIVFLHGSGTSDPVEARAGWQKNRTLDGPQASAHKDPAFPFVTASLLSFGGWSPPAVHEAIDEIVAKYRIDEDQIILCGFSMGAMGTWEVACDRPERFAALVPVGGRTGVLSRMASLRAVPVWVFNGGSDPVTTPEDARRAVAALEKAGGTVRYTEFPGLGHGESNLAWSKPELYEWLLKQHR